MVPDSGSDSQVDEFVPVATFLFPDVAEVACSLLRSYDIHFYLENDHTLAKVWWWSIALGGLRVMVPASLAADARELLDASTYESSEQELQGTEQEMLAPSSVDELGGADQGYGRLHGALTAPTSRIFLVITFLLGVPSKFGPLLILVR